MESTFDIRYYFENYINNITEFFSEKIAEMQAFQDYQTQQIQELINKIITLGILAVILILIIIILSIALKISRKGKERRRIHEAEARLRREEERLREQRRFYEEQNRLNGYDDYGYQDDKYGHGEYRNSWTPESRPRRRRSGFRDMIPERESRAVRERASKTTQYYYEDMDEVRNNRDEWF